MESRRAVPIHRVHWANSLIMAVIRYQPYSLHCRRAYRLNSVSTRNGCFSRYVHPTNMLCICICYDTINMIPPFHPRMMSAVFQCDELILLRALAIVCVGHIKTGTNRRNWSAVHDHVDSPFIGRIRTRHLDGKGMSVMSPISPQTQMILHVDAKIDGTVLGKEIHGTLYFIHEF